MFFLPVLIALFEPLANSLLSSFKDAPVLVVVMAFFIAWVGCWLPVALVTAIALNWQPFKAVPPESQSPRSGDPPTELAHQRDQSKKLPLLVSLYLLAPLILWLCSWLTNTSFLNYGFIGNISILGSLGLGFGLGVVSLAIVYAGQFSLGWCSFVSTPSIASRRPILLPILLIALLVGGIEELVFRGFLFTELEQAYPVWAAATISSLIFALLHLVWEQLETIPQLPGLWLMGMVLVLARFVDGGSLGLAWGLHAGWVWAIACLDTAQLINYTGKVSEWVTGKNKKPLAGVAGIICVLATGVILWLFYGFKQPN